MFVSARVYLTKCRMCAIWVPRRDDVERRLSDRAYESVHVFLQGRHDEQMVDASALRADEGRGIAAISVGEPRAGCDPTISEWGNPITFG